jgi:hypothetical protein
MDSVCIDTVSGSGAEGSGGHNCEYRQAALEGRQFVGSPLSRAGSLMDLGSAQVSAAPEGR